MKTQLLMPQNTQITSKKDQLTQTSIDVFKSRDLIFRDSGEKSGQVD